MCPSIIILSYLLGILFRYFRKFRKISILVNIFAKYWFSSNFLNISIFSQILKNFDFSHNLRKISIFVKFSK